ncbi:caffeoyl-CoA O-methyltransferase [Vigna angularis]|uniref:Caffeoyl-CoA O-methyltransferase n=1 Tax=Phaseolus angularis TaxID=3914 RepID=A0A8T0LDZ4_PHAAN|nr:caffeoyl-CoA O-methyltransferase [Vigna angularis]
MSKTALKLAVSRLNLLKNKSELHVWNLRKELADFLRSGHNHAARVKVEYVVMEEKTMGAYDLIKIYCELITARLPVIESQKNCPMDLKEAISSVIFASPRCSDIPELVDVKKHFTANIVVQLVEKLSPRAPDGPTKIRILIEIAEEYNVKWQPSLEENDEKLSHDLLRVPLVGDEEEHPSLHASCQLKEMQDKSRSFCEKNGKLNSSGTRNQEEDFGNLCCESTSAFQKGRHNWEMEFKHAATAAQAAAESAERASVAAKAAAELSNREKLIRQCSGEWQSSCRGGFRAELSLEYAFHSSKHLSAGYAASTFRRSAFEINVREQNRLVGPHNEHFMNGDDNVVKPYQKVQGEANKESSGSGSDAYLDCDTSDSEDGVSEQNSVILAHPSKTAMIPDKEETSKPLNCDKDIPSKEKIIAMDPDRKAYEIGLPFIKRAGVQHKIDFIESPALPVLDKLLEDAENEGSFDFAFIDADKNNYWNYHERVMRLVKIGGIVAYDNALWGGTVALPEKAVSKDKQEWRLLSLAFNEAISKDCRVQIAFVSIGDGVIFCRRIA